MAEKSKTREIVIVDKGGTFNTLLKKFSQEKESYDFEALSALRKLLSNEKARLLHTIKTKSPKSIYELAKILKRDFKSVKEDIKLLQRFGFIDFIAEKTGKRERLRPILTIDTLHIQIKI
ncbi:ArsR family transcriptional regulator [Candidatus Pacearchaeota archaeon]|nr:ArsR family transcriptional regulator [Candidatus Pacearchaeota archaeon]|tara:strand:+ start:400 stop:759 length:360 start_codon:yes stop_codon:yes gene_type:complete